jgi:predicted DNA-binding transcriptional regulator YafY
MVNKLEDKIYSEQFNQPSVIDFEKNDLLTGIEWLDILYKQIISQTAIQITYQSFKARSANEFVFYPYLLKEYRNRWFILGMKKEQKEILTLALDRIQKVEPLANELYRRNKNFEPHTYFKDLIGVTKNVADTPTHIVFIASHRHAPYIKTKPIHASQQIVETRKEGIVFSIDVVPNFELERELLGFGEGIKILSPSNIIRLMKRKTRLMFDAYHENDLTKSD